MTRMRVVTATEDDSSRIPPEVPAKSTLASAAEASCGKLAIDTRMNAPPISGPERGDLNAAIGTRSSYAACEGGWGFRIWV